MTQIETQDTTTQFSQNKIHNTLFMIRDNTRGVVIGYVNLHPEDNHWFYFVKDFTSPEFNSAEDAITALAEHYLVIVNDRLAIKAGIFDDARYTQGR